MLGFGRKGHPRKHDIADALSHKGNIYDALIGAMKALTASNVAVDKETFDIRNYELFEHFLRNTAYIPDSGSVQIYNNYFKIGAGTPSQTISSEFKLTSGATAGNALNMTCLLTHNPSNYTYYQWETRFKIDSVNIQNENIGLLDANIGGDHYALIAKGTDAGTIKLVTSDNAGTNTTTTDNITCDITVFNVYAIKVKSGQTKLFLNGNLVATHTTNVFYNVAEGVISYYALETSEAVARVFTIDYNNILLGRAF